MSSDDVLSAFLGAFLIVWLVIMLISIAVSILRIIANWKLYEKAGEPGWSAIVPVYNMMQMIKIATGTYKLAWVYLGLYGGYFVANMLLSFFPLFINDTETASLVTLGLTVLLMLVAIPMIVLGGYISYMFPKSYGKSPTFCALSIIFNSITFIIMGFEKSTQYVGPKGEPQFNSFNNYNNYY